MSDLQIGLAMLGVLIVAAVLAFNWWQERKFRRRGEETFSGRHDDVLFGRPSVPSAPAAASPPLSLDEPRIEPSMEPRLEPQLDSAPAVAARTASSPGPQSGVVDVPRPEIDYIVEIRAGEFIAVAKRSEEHTSELQSHSDLVCRLLLEKKKKCKRRAARVARRGLKVKIEMHAEGDRQRLR